MKRIKTDRRASIIGLPIDLMVISIVIAVAVPSIWSLSGMYAGSQMDNELESEFEQIDYMMNDMSDGRMGEQREISIDVSDNIFKGVRYIRGGGETFSDMTTLRYQIEGHRAKTYILKEGVLINHTGSSTTKTERSFSLPSDGDTFGLKYTGKTMEGKPVFEVKFF